MDILAALTGSRVRADVLATMFGGRAKPWKPMELERVTRRPHSPIYRELRRLAKAGLLRATLRDGKHEYEPDPDVPIGREVARLVLQTRGRVPRIRHALVQLRSRSIAWIIRGTAGSGSAVPRTRPANALIVLTAAPRSLVRVQLVDVVAGSMEIHCMSSREWVTRLEKGDVFLQRARRARKLWVLGGWEELVAREKGELESDRLLKAARSSWREELSDEWDEDWDPFAPVAGPR